MPAAAPLRRQRSGYRPLHGTVVLTDADRKVLRLLESPPIRSWPRAVLAEAAGMADRSLRKSIERLRHSGFAVVSSSGGSDGYSIARTAAEVADFRERELHSRMRVIADESRALQQVERLMRDRERERAPAMQGALL